MKYVSPFDRGYLFHYDHVAQFNRGIMNQISLDLNEVFRGFEGKIAVVTTGSDGRLEKGPFSPMEIRVYGEERDLEESLGLLRKYISEEKGIKLFDDYIETKDLSGCRMSYYDKVIKGEEILLVSPNRFFDSEILFEKNGIYEKAFRNFVEELRGDKGRSIFGRVKAKSKEYRRVTTSGKQKYGGEILDHYDIEQGLAFYDPEQKLWSFKQGPLRLVQFSLVKDLIRKIRKDNSDKTPFFNLPKNTIDRISRIEVEGRTSLSVGEIEDLSDCYKFFLHLYHKSQFHYAQNVSKLVEFDPKEVKERCETLERICSFPIIN